MNMLPSKQTCILFILSIAACLVNAVPSGFLEISLMEIQAEIERLIREQTGTQDRYTSLIFTILTSSYIFTSVPGSLVGWKWCNKYGQKSQIFGAAPLIMVFGCILNCLAFPFYRIELLLIGRMLCGISCGISATVVPVYVTEISPPELRGTLGALYGAGGGIGLIISTTCGLPGLLGSKNAMPYLHLVPAAIAGLSFVFYFWAPESPRYVFSKTNDEGKCRNILQFLCLSEDDAQSTIEEYQKEINKGNLQQCGIITAMAIPFYRATIFLSVFICICWGMSGYYALTICLAEFLTDVGMDHLEAQYLGGIVSGIADMLASTLAPVPVHFFGRKTIFMVTYFILFLAYCGNFVLLYLQDIDPNLDGKLVSYIVFTLYLIITVFHTMGPSALIYLVPPEISPPEIRPLSSGLGNIFRSVSQALSQLYFYPWFLAVRHVAFLPFIITMTAAILVTAYLYPETKGLTVTQAVAKWKDLWEQRRFWCC